MIRLGVIPREWRRANVSPIYKKGARNIAENYRPVSLTSIICKIMEKFVKEVVIILALPQSPVGILVLINLTNITCQYNACATQKTLVDITERRALDFRGHFP